MALDDKPDYRTMSGGEFKHAVGCDPDKWAEAFLQREEHEAMGPLASRENRLARLRDWFADAIQAARDDERRYRPEGDRW